MCGELKKQFIRIKIVKPTKKCATWLEEMFLKILSTKETGLDTVCNRCATHIVFNDLKLTQGKLQSFKKAL